MRETLSCYWHKIQNNLFPFLTESYGPLTKKQEQLIKILELVRIEEHVGYISKYSVGRPLKNRPSLARSFVAKVVYNITTTSGLVERLHNDKILRNLCGWSKRCDIPSESTFSRSFGEFTRTRLVERTHQALVGWVYEGRIVGHISRDSTAIHAREKAPKKSKPKLSTPKKRGRPKKGEVRPSKPLSRLEKQLEQPLSRMISSLPKQCNVGTKRNSKGYQESWKGYKLHLDVADGDIPVSALLTSASLHDSQAAIPLAIKTAQSVTSLYDLMDAAYDDPHIKEHSRQLGHVPIIDKNPRRNKELKQQIKHEEKARKILGISSPAKKRYNQRSSVERVNGRIKDEFTGNTIYYKGHEKIFSHLMLAVLAVTADQVFRLIS